MDSLTIHSTHDAPAPSKPLLEAAQKKFGMVPNLLGVLAASPQALWAYMNLGNLFSSTSFSPTERTVIWQTLNYENDCAYCMAAHTAIAHGERVAPEILEALRDHRALNDSKLEALRSFTASLTRNRGRAPQEDLEAFLAAGYEPKHILEVLVGLSHKVISNYANHVANTPLDAPFEKFAWKKGTVESA